MLSLEWIMRRGVLFHSKLGRLPAINCVTLRAFAFAGAGLELAFMRIGSMAIRTLREFQRPLEIALGMAIDASNLQVHAQQRIFCFGMVEWRGHVDLRPSTRGMARFTGSLESAFVRIGVTRGTSVELDARKLHGMVRP